MTPLTGSRKTAVLHHWKKVTEGYRKPCSGGNKSTKINVLVACGQIPKIVPKISSIHYFEPGAHTEGVTATCNLRTVRWPMCLYSLNGTGRWIVPRSACMWMTPPEFAEPDRRWSWWLMSRKVTMLNITRRQSMRRQCCANG